MTLIRRLLLVIIRIYKITFSSILRPACRFTPSCSEYACDALTYHNLYKALILIVSRILRCHPWGSYGFDPVPRNNIKQ